MLTNLLAVFIVILLASPSIAFAKDSKPDNSQVAEVSGSVNARSVQISEGAKDDSSKGSRSTQPTETAKAEEAAADEEVEPTVGGDRCPLPPSQEGDDSRVLTARLKGSLCVSCLFQLEKKLQGLSGVKSARIIRPPKKVDPDASERSFAQVQIIYLSSKVTPKKIRLFVHRNDFDIRDEKDIALTDDFKPLPDPFEKERSTVIDAQYR